MTLTPERIEEIERPEWATDTTDALWRDGRKYVADYVQWLNAGNSIGSLSPHAATALIHHFAHALAKSALSTSRVKALEWKRLAALDVWSAADGAYWAWQRNGVGYWRRWWPNEDKTHTADDQDAAKAIAQADYEARILSQIIDTPTLEPAPATVTEGMR